MGSHGYTYTNEVLAKTLADEIKRQGHIPGTTEWHQLGLRPCTATIHKRFGTWNRFLETFGYPPRREYCRVVSAIKTLARHEATYLAGIIDGEGYIVRPRLGKRSRMSISNTSVDWLVHIQKMVQGGRIVAERKYPVPGHSKTWTLNFAVEETYDLIRQIIPYLIVKREKALEMLAQINKGGGV